MTLPEPGGYPPVVPGHSRAFAPLLGVLLALPITGYSTPPDSADPARGAFARLNPEAQASLELVRARSTPGTYSHWFGGDQRLLGVSGNLESANCAGLATDEAVHCFLNENRELFSSRSPIANPATMRRLRSFSGQFAGEEYVHYVQYHQNAHVRLGVVKAHFRHGRLVGLNASLAGESRLRQRATPPSDDHIRNLAQTSVGQPVALGIAEYDAQSGRFLRRFYVDGQTDTMFAIDEETGLLVSEPAESRAGGNTTQSVFRYSYTKDADANQVPLPTNPACQAPNNTLTVPLGFPPPPQQTVTAACGEWSGGSCFTGTGWCLFSMWNYNLPPDYPQMKSETPGDPNGPGVYHQKSALCALSPWENEPSVDAKIANAYAVMTETAVIKNHWGSYVPAGGPGKTLIAVVLNTAQPTCAGGPTPACFDPDLGSPNPHARVILGSGGGGTIHSAYRAGRIVHEYGHYVENLFGLDSDLAVSEGWADTWPLRYAIYKLVATGEWASHYYMGRDETARLYMHRGRTLRGERLIDPMTGGGHDQPYYPSSYCADTTKPHQCGSVIPQIYWELAWNRAQLSYGGVSQGEQLVTGGPYGANGWHLANSAFAHAISMAVPGTDVRAYMAAVASRYADFAYIYAYLSGSDLQKIYDVMAHHCLGPNSYCGVSHHLPGSPLPSVFTHKEAFNDAENALPFSAYGYVVHQDASSFGYGRFNQIGKIITLTIDDVPNNSPSTRKLLASARAGNNLLMIYRINGGSWTFADDATAPTGAQWTWWEMGDVAPVEGTNVVDIYLYQGSIELDALAIAAGTPSGYCTCPSGADSCPNLP